jgi:hypothetical protein
MVGLLLAAGITQPLPEIGARDVSFKPRQPPVAAACRRERLRLAKCLIMIGSDMEPSDKKTSAHVSLRPGALWVAVRADVRLLTPGFSVPGLTLNPGKSIP